MRTRLARLLLAAARRLDPALDTRPRRIADVTADELVKVQDAINAAVRRPVYVSGGTITPLCRIEDAVGPIKLSEGDQWLPDEIWERAARLGL